MNKILFFLNNYIKKFRRKVNWSEIGFRQHYKENRRGLDQLIRKRHNANVNKSANLKYYIFKMITTLKKYDSIDQN